MPRAYHFLEINLCRLGRRMKPQLPPEIANHLPDDILFRIQSFVPHFPKPKKEKVQSVSPNMERDLRKIQTKLLHGKDNMYMRDLDVFILC